MLHGYALTPFASVIGLPTAAVTVSGTRPVRDAAIVGAGVDLGSGRNVALYAQVEGASAGSHAMIGG
jgi:uncharacterized protein with beta-barrel porin domain